MDDFITAMRDPATVPAERIPAVLAALAAVQSALAARLLAAPAPASGASATAGELLGVEEAAKRAHCSPSHLYRIWRTIPGAGRVGRRLVFPASSLRDLVRTA